MNFRIFVPEVRYPLLFPNYFKIRDMHVHRSSRSSAPSQPPASIFASMKPEPAPVPAPGQVDAPIR
jgi:hypothetical protein